MFVNNRSICVVFFVLLGLNAAVGDDGLPIWNAKRWANFTQIDCSRTEWIHIPKTGSTFCLSMQHVCCPDKFENLTNGITVEDLEFAETHKHARNKPFHYFSHYCYRFIRTGYEELDSHNCPFTGVHQHVPLNRRINKQQAMVMMREPKSRIISAFIDGMHHEGTNPSVWNKAKAKMKEISATKYDSNTKLMKTAAVYTNLTEMHSCQTKMMLGKGCASSIPLKRQAAEAAQERLRDFFFVGLTEEFERSLLLFHELANVSTVPTAVELFPQRVTSTKSQYSYLADHFDELNYKDPNDEALYETAKQIFEEEIAYVKRWKGIDI